tara:strand:+ start:45050 stop:45883 length:834 start_codon:yes stop_codon:yes gene_type:complete
MKMDGFERKFRLDQSFALVTGGAGLLGVQHAHALLEIGAHVVIADLSSDNIEKVKDSFKGTKCTFELLDVSNEDSVESLLKNLKKKNINIDILINNAAIDPKVGKNINSKTNKNRLENFSVLEWDKQINVGLKGAFLCSKVFGTSMANQKGGVILNIASDLSIISPDQRIYRSDGLEEEQQNVKPITYSVIKSGMIGLTKYLATYWANKNVRCNALSPGGIFNEQDAKFVSKVSELIPMGRMANRDEYKNAIQFLCSKASSYMTGHNLVMDGGRTIW